MTTYEKNTEMTKPARLSRHLSSKDRATLRRDGAVVPFGPPFLLRVTSYGHFPIHGHARLQAAVASRNLRSTSAATDARS